MKMTRATSDEASARAELLGIANDLRAATGRARALMVALKKTAEFRQAQALSRKGDDNAATAVLPWYWAGGLGDVIEKLRYADRGCRDDARTKAVRS